MAYAHTVFLEDDFEFDEIDTVFDDEADSDEVRRSLINHDGYSSSIVVRREDSDEDLDDVSKRQRGN